jgi:hypothetical protein
MADFVTKTGSLLEPLLLTLLGSDGAPIDLTLATAAVFSLREPLSGALAVDGGALAILAPPTAGKVRYDWAAGDVDTAGLYLGEVELSWPGDLNQRVPNDGYYVVDLQTAVEASG